MDLLLQGIYSFFCVVGFSIIFNLPRKLIPYASLSGALGWVVYYIIQNHSSSFIAPALVGSIIVGLVGEALAHIKHHPATLFTIPGIIPFVPGYGIYYTMLYIVETDFDNALSSGAESLFIAISIACGMMIATSIVRIIKRLILAIRPVH